MLAAQAAVDTAGGLAQKLTAQSTQAQVTAAQNAVNEANAKVTALPASATKTALQNRVTVAQGSVTTAQARFDAAATQAVVNAETLANALVQDGTETTVKIDAAQTAINNAQVLVNALPPVPAVKTAATTVKADLQARLVAAQKKVDSAKTEVADLEKAAGLVGAFTAKVDTVDEVKELVANGAKRQEVAASYIPASNSLQQVKSSSRKTELVNNLEAANDLVIAASFVDALQKATGDLKTVDSINQAKLKLTSAKGNVASLPTSDIKVALQELVTTEEAKITAAEKALFTPNVTQQKKLAQGSQIQITGYLTSKTKKTGTNGQNTVFVLADDKTQTGVDRNNAIQIPQGTTYMSAELQKVLNEAPIDSLIQLNGKLDKYNNVISLEDITSVTVLK